MADTTELAKIILEFIDQLNRKRYDTGYTVLETRQIATKSRKVLHKWELDEPFDQPAIAEAHKLLDNALEEIQKYENAYNHSQRSAGRDFMGSVVATQEALETFLHRTGYLD